MYMTTFLKEVASENAMRVGGGGEGGEAREGKGEGEGG